MKNYKLYQGALITALMTSAIVAAPTVQAAKGFTDVDYTKEYGAAVQSLVERGIISGYSDGTFKPFADVTRGQAAKILAGLLKLDTEKVVDPKFTDLLPNDEYYGAIAALQNANIVSGLADGSFGANRAITREQMASMLTAAFNLTDYDYDGNLPFKDIVRNSNAYYSIGPLYENNITKGVTADTFGLKETVKRSQLALFIQRIENLEKNRVRQSFKAKDLGGDVIEVIAANNWIAGTEEEFFRVRLQNDKVDIEALHEGTGSFVVASYKLDGDENYEYIGLNKYRVTVTMVDGKLQMVCEETDELSPGTVLFFEEDHGINAKNLKLETKDGHTVSPKVYSYKPYRFDGWEKESIPSGTAYELTLLEAGEYVATFSDDAGKSVRVGIHAAVDGYDIYLSEAKEIKELFVPTKEIGFEVQSYKVEQYTGALIDEELLDVAFSKDGVTVKRVGTGNAVFSVRLMGENGQKLYVHGSIYAVSGVTSMYYELSTQEEMEEPPY
ncbi:S-layer homology domain-containing protein [Lysinibacillus sp. NPDC097287]|uniref:S-layer homology domain-containing protein n=1 Tax=Lysinibacillus sp. NPDC097287 TaxID=3364144 RepID=UPI003820008F